MRRPAYVTVYDLQMRKVAYLENAFDVSYEAPMNAIWTASFSLPANDEKNMECQPLYFVEIFDGDERLELFRILKPTTKRGSDGPFISYECEHVLGTLLDDVLFLYHTVGNLGVYTRDVLQYILSKQTVKRWQLGTIEFDRQFEYNWENDNLLGALFSVPNPFPDEYMWAFDTTTYPWRLNLIKPSEQEELYIRYGVNLQGITRVVDASKVSTRIFGLGYGEGVNQLTFADLNGGKPYIDAEPALIQKYGIVQTIFVDRRFEYPETLLARCQTLMEELKVPSVHYTVDAAEIYALTNDPIDRFKSGAMVRVQDQELGVDIKARVVKVGKGDVLGQPGAVTLEIANKSQDIAGSIAELRNRMHISEVYAQGATNYDSHDFADNCDPTHPAVLRFWLPAETARVNKVALSFRVEPFRGYSRAIESAPSVSSGPSTRNTTAAGGATTPTTSTKATSVESASTSDNWRIFAIDVMQAVNMGGAHNHGIASGTKLMKEDGTSVTFVESGAHTHNLTADHSHSVTIPAHNHTVTIPEHTHQMDHTHTIPGHTHEIEFGIWEGPTPSEVQVRVDGKLISGVGSSGEEIDIVPYLSKDNSGRINRGDYHEITITPVDSLGRVVASVFTQIFAQSRGGGDY
ncbi:phage tail protein [Paenibacillus sp. JNUCC31]|uniref:phage tail protein n=1 Tax=Paenibacillus sp. JNUCC-31 TaxID=2777983 RepID=UPI001781FAF0|nr:phage tail protein [Paenibacillus sp. JNUCC-31]QOS77960.1 phage tail protein [Paenibacillus sp. JNUCC-31]QOS78004.1 phage tail protein [Paenibacillus sp. JNUCC-31]